METVLVLAVFAAIFGGVMWLVIRDRRIWREGIAGMRERHGWTIRERCRIAGRPARALIAAPGAPEPARDAYWPPPDPDGREEDWIAAAVPSSGSSSKGGSGSRKRKGGSKPGGTSRPGFLEWRAPAPRWDAGILVLGPRLPEAILSRADSLLPMLDHPLARNMLSRLFGDALMGNLPDLRHLPPPPGTERPFTVFASADPGNRVQLDAVADILSGFRPVDGDAQSGAPIVVLAPEGMRVRISRPARKPEDVERFVELALQLQETLVPRA